MGEKHFVSFKPPNYAVILFLIPKRPVTAGRECTHRLDLFLSSTDYVYVTIGQVKIVFHYNMHDHAGEYVLTFMWCLKVTEAYNCNQRLRDRPHAPKLVRDDISHSISISSFFIIIFFSKMYACGLLGFCFLPNVTLRFSVQRYMAT